MTGHNPSLRQCPACQQSVSEDFIETHMMVVHPGWPGYEGEPPFLSCGTCTSLRSPHAECLEHGA
jgi:hypothetical protein